MHLILSVCWDKHLQKNEPLSCDPQYGLLNIRTAQACDKPYIDLQIGQAMFIPSSSTGSSSEHVAIATQDTLSVMAPGKGFLSTLDHVIGGKLSCMDCTADRLAVGVGSYGYGTLGNKVMYKIKRNI